MTLGNSLTCTNSTAFGIYSNKKIDGVKKIPFQGRKFTAWVGFVTFLFVTSLVTVLVLYSSEFFNSPKTPNHDSNNTEHLPNIKPLPHTSSLLNDVVIIPGNQQPKMSSRKMDQHPNHRYSEIEPSKEFSEKTNNLYTETGWFPKPFEVTKEETTEITENIASKHSANHQNIKGVELINGKLNNLGSPMRLKGVYMQINSEEDGELRDQVHGNSDSYYNLKEINELMQKDSLGNRKGGNWSMEKAFKGRGLPFRLPPKAPEILKRHQTGHFKIQNLPHSKGKPLTILLDIYPMIENRFYKPNPQKGGHFSEDSTRGASLHQSLDTRNRMIMKLNLYPKKINQQGITGSYVGKMMYPRHVQRAERRTFGWFPKYKKKKSHSKKCAAVAVFPNGKPVKAKWKDSNGDWIHAKQVKVKFSKSEEYD